MYLAIVISSSWAITNFKVISLVFDEQGKLVQEEKIGTEPRKADVHIEGIFIYYVANRKSVIKYTRIINQCKTNLFRNRCPESAHS